MLRVTALPTLAPILFAALLGATFVAGCGVDGTAGDADGSDGAARTIVIMASEYAFNGDPGVIEPGDTIVFDVENVGALDHSLEVLSSTGSSLGRTARITPGDTDRVTVTFDDAGVYRLICDVDDHLSRGQTASITVG